MRDAYRFLNARGKGTGFHERCFHMLGERGTLSPMLSREGVCLRSSFLHFLDVSAFVTSRTNLSTSTNFSANTTSVRDMRCRHLQCHYLKDVESYVEGLSGYLEKGMLTEEIQSKCHKTILNLIELCSTRTETLVEHVQDGYE